MAQTYTLEEAANKLNLSVEEFKRRLRGEWTQVRAFRDGNTLRFRANEVDELARSIGLGSSEELPMAESSPLDLPSDIGIAPDDSADVATGPRTPRPAKKGDSDAPLKLDDSDEAFVLTPDKAPSSKKMKKDSDSDVRLEKGDRKAAADDEESILTDEITVPAEGGGSGRLSGKSGKLSSAQLKSGDSGKTKGSDATKSDSGKAKAASDSGKSKAPPAEDSSDFELALDQADSDEFELSLAQDSSEEVALGAPPAAPGSKAGQSGINLNRPADSGVSLERKKKSDDEEVDFELSLDAPGSGTSSKKSGKKVKADSDSEFELTLEEPSDLSGELAIPAAEKKGDIFEATDFEIPALEDDSASEAVSLDEADTDLESSDFDLALDEADAASDDESESQVVALDEEDRRKARPKRGRKRSEDAVDADDMELEEGASASAALRGVRSRDEDEEDEDYEVSEAADEGEVRPAAQAQWGPWPAILMIPTALVMFFGALMAFETLHSVWGYQQGTTASTPLVSWFADQAGMKPSQ
jgi:hypothetical protein